MTAFLAATDLPKVQLPIITTSAGQSTDVNTVNIIFEESEIGFDYCDVPPLELIKAGVGLNDEETSEGFHIEINTDLNKFKKRTPYKTIAIAIGASLKGMGASGLTIEDELKRLESLIQYCQKNGISRIVLNASDAGKPIYEKSGFVSSPETMRLFIK